MISDKYINEFLKDIELHKVYTDKDRPPFKTPQQIAKEEELLKGE
jgi:hypothetical protein